MGHFSYTCLLSGLPITEDDSVYFQLLKENRYYKYTKDKKCGSSSIISNETTRLKFDPFALPIQGTYDGYGKIDNIIEDENTKILEQYFGLSIGHIIDIVCSGRKDDGYDDCLLDLKVDPEQEYGEEVEYKEEYKELLSLSATWFRTEVIEKLDTGKTGYIEFELGKPYVLEYLGFEKKDGSVYQKDGVELSISNRSLEGDKGSIYTMDTLYHYLRLNKVNTNGKIDDLMKMDKVDALYNFETESIIDFENFSEIEKEKALSLIRVKHPSIYERIVELDDDAIQDMSMNILSDEYSEFDYLLLNYNDYASPLYYKYVSAAKKGELKKMVRHNRIISDYLYATGRYYDLIGTSPQDGEFYGVQELLKASLSVNADKMTEEDEMEDVEYSDYDNQFLKVAAKKGYLNVIEDHFDNNFDIDIFNIVLTCAIKYDQVDIIKDLLDRASTEGIVSRAFYTAVQYKSTECLDYIMSHQKFINEHITDRLTTAHKDEEVLFKLLNHPEFDLDKIDFNDYYIKHNDITKGSLSSIMADIRDQKIDEILS